MEITINKIVTEVTEEALEQFSKPVLFAHCEISGITVSKGKIGKTELIELIVDHYESITDQPITDQPIADQPIADQPIAEQPIADQTVTFIPSPDNAPTGMVYCKNCMNHVPKSKTVPTSEMGVYICLMGCKKGSGLAQAAKAASQAARIKANPSPKVKTTTNSSPRKALFADTDIITSIGPRKTKGFSAVAFGALREGMTVKEACNAIAALETGAITGRSELKYDVDNKWITIVTAEQYKADQEASDADPEA